MLHSRRLTSNLLRPAFLIAISATWLLPLATPAAAAEGRFELTPSIGYQFAGEIDLGDREPTFDLDEDSTFGISLGVPLSGGLLLEFRAMRFETQLQDDTGLFDPVVGGDDLELTYAHVGIAYQWGPGQVMPFVGVSAGVTELSPGNPGADDDVELSISGGGGVKIFLSDHFGLRFEGRGYFTDVGEDDDFCGRRNRRCDDENGLTHAEVSVGAIFSW